MEEIHEVQGVHPTLTHEHEHEHGAVEEPAQVQVEVQDVPAPETDVGVTVADDHHAPVQEGAPMQAEHEHGHEVQVQVQVLPLADDSHEHEHEHAQVVDPTHQIEPAQIEQVQVQVEPTQVEPTPVDTAQHQQVEPTQIETAHEHEHEHEHEQAHEHAQVEPAQVEPQMHTIEHEVHLLRDSVRMLQEQNEQLLNENTNLKRQLGHGHGGGVGVNGVNVESLIPSEHDTTATAAAAAQLSNYQNALALSETQKSQLINEIQALRNRLTSLGYSVGEGVGVGGVKVDGDASASAAAAAAQIDITEAEALMAIDQTGAAAAAHAHTPGAIGTHPALHVHPATPGGTNDGGVVLTPNTAGLSSRSEEKWEMHFVRLSQYKAQHGNCLVPTSTELGRWLCRQRHNYRYKSLKEDRRQRLMDLDKTCLGERVADLSSPIPMKDGEGGAGAAGAGTIQGADGTIVDGSHVDVMPTLNSKTKYNQAYESKLHAKWDRYFQELVAYKEKHGHCNFPTMNGSLGRWISRQRTLYRSKKLKTDRYEKLKNLGFAFEDATALEFKGKLDQQWEDMFNKLLEHKARKGHCFDVPETWPLGKWLYRQRWLYRHGNLREDRAKKLLDIGFEDKKVLKKDSSLGRKKRKRADVADEIIVGPPPTEGPNVEELEHHVVTEEVAAAAVTTVENDAVPPPVETDQSIPPSTVDVPPPVAAEDAASVPIIVPPPVVTEESMEDIPHVPPPTMGADETAIAMDVEKTNEATETAVATVNNVIDASDAVVV